MGDLEPVYYLFTIVCEISLPQADMWTTPKMHNKMRETLRNANKTKALTTIARQKMAKEKP